MSVKLTNLDKIYYPQIKATKGDVINYYRLVAHYILPHLKDRPLTIKRFPDGVNGVKIYQRHLGKSSKFSAKTAKIYVAEKKTAKSFIICHDLNNLLYLAQLGTIEFHPWYSTINPNAPDKVNRSRKFTSPKSLPESILNYPSFVIFDLDPPVGQFSKSVPIALSLKKLLDKLHLTPFVKTSGKKGLHVYVPIKRQYNFEKVRGFARAVGEQLLSQGLPITLEVRKNKRKKGHTFFDINQNALAKSLVAVYSLRATPTATVSFPVEWGRLAKIRPEDFTIKNVPKILSRQSDPWLPLIKGHKNATLP